jgi:4-hydroxybenzoate polyprenyltransferase
MQYRLLSRRFLGAYLVTMRPYLLFVSGITGIAGMSLAPELPGPAAVLIALAAFFSYGFGQALTDCFQIDTDRLSSPYRLLTHGTIGRSQVLGVSVVGLTGCVAVLTWFNPWNLLLGAVAGAGLATYTLFKRKWCGGPWYNAWIVVVLAIMAFLAAGGHTEGAHGALPWTMGAVFFGYANFVLAGYFKDIAADKQTNYRTMPVVLGRAPAVPDRNSCPAICVPAGFFASRSHKSRTLTANSTSRAFMSSPFAIFPPGINGLIIHYPPSTDN